MASIFGLDKVATEKFAQQNNLRLLWDKPIMPGDLYLAKRNNEYQLLTCRDISTLHCFIIPVDSAYCFEMFDCVKVANL